MDTVFNGRFGPVKVGFMRWVIACVAALFAVSRGQVGTMSAVIGAGLPATTGRALGPGG